MFCIQCGAKCSDEATFCMVCGKSLQQLPKNPNTEILNVKRRELVNLLKKIADMKDETPCVEATGKQTLQEISMKCYHCGADIVPGAKFCASCGQNIEAIQNVKTGADTNSNNDEKTKQSTDNGIFKKITEKLFDIPIDEFKKKTSIEKALIITRGAVDIFFGIYLIVVVLMFLLSLAGCSKAVDLENIGPFLLVVIPTFAVNAILGYFEKKYYQTHERKHTIDVFWIASVICMLISLIAMVNIMSPSARSIRIVQKGSLEAYPDITIEKAFDSKFSGGKWEAEQFGKDYYVTYTGRSIFFGLVDVSFFVSPDNGTFSMDSVKVDGNELDFMEFAFFISQVFENGNSTGMIDMPNDFSSARYGFPDMGERISYA